MLFFKKFGNYIAKHKVKAILSCMSIIVIVFLCIGFQSICKDYTTLVSLLKRDIQLYEESPSAVELVQVINDLKKAIKVETSKFVFNIVVYFSPILLIICLNTALYVHRSPIPEQVASAKQAKKERKKAALQAKLDALNSEDEQE